MSAGARSDVTCLTLPPHTPTRTHTATTTAHTHTVGHRKTITHLDGREVPVRFTGVTQPFEVRHIADEGMPVHGFPSQRGTLHVKYIVDLPPVLSAEQIAAVEKLFQ